MISGRVGLDSDYRVFLGFVIRFVVGGFFIEGWIVVVFLRFFGRWVGVVFIVGRGCFWFVGRIMFSEIVIMMWVCFFKVVVFRFGVY